MAQQPPRTPPRFVPTLTEVVQTPDAVPAHGAPGAPLAPASPVAAGRTTVVSSPLPPVVRPAAAGVAAPAVQVSAVRPPLPSAQPPAVMTQRPAPAPAPVPASIPAPAAASGSAGVSASASATASAPVASANANTAASPLAAAASAGVLTRRLPAVDAPAPPPASAPRAMVAPPAVARALPDGFEEYMVHRVMQRVDVVLDQRLREAIATVVQEQTRSVLPRLREEIESVVRHAVYEAVADELASGTPVAPKG
ncbi:hypothetical protein ACIGHN_13660 [Acidovorax sp. NPDC077693]|uniref:hypothetical protein n=1 Tax=unclassified Acidovorax TaxID=2684926 RepID=UPI0037C8FA6A